MHISVKNRYLANAFLFFLLFKIYFHWFDLFFMISGALMYLNEATLLNNIRTRYFKDSIYVSNYSQIMVHCSKQFNSTL